MMRALVGSLELKFVVRREEDERVYDFDRAMLISPSREAKRAKARTVMTERRR